MIEVELKGMPGVAMRQVVISFPEGAPRVVGYLREGSLATNLDWLDLDPEEHAEIYMRIQQLTGRDYTVCQMQRPPTGFWPTAKRDAGAAADSQQSRSRALHTVFGR